MPQLSAPRDDSVDCKKFREVVVEKLNRHYIARSETLLRAVFDLVSGVDTGVAARKNIFATDAVRDAFIALAIQRDLTAPAAEYLLGAVFHLVSGGDTGVEARTNVFDRVVGRGFVETLHTFAAVGSLKAMDLLVALGDKFKVCGEKDPLHALGAGPSCKRFLLHYVQYTSNNDSGKDEAMKCAATAVLAGERDQDAAPRFRCSAGQNMLSGTPPPPAFTEEMKRNAAVQINWVDGAGAPARAFRPFYERIVKHFVNDSLSTVHSVAKLLPRVAFASGRTEVHICDLLVLPFVLWRLPKLHEQDSPRQNLVWAVAKEIAHDVYATALLTTHPLIPQYLKQDVRQDVDLRNATVDFTKPVAQRVKVVLTTRPLAPPVFALPKKPEKQLEVLVLNQVLAALRCTDFKESVETVFESRTKFKRDTLSLDANTAIFPKSQSHPLLDFVIVAKDERTLILGQSKLDEKLTKATEDTAQALILILRGSALLKDGVREEIPEGVQPKRATKTDEEATKTKKDAKEPLKHSKEKAVNKTLEIIRNPESWTDNRPWTLIGVCTGLKKMSFSAVPSNALFDAMIHIHADSGKSRLAVSWDTSRDPASTSATAGRPGGEFEMRLLDACAEHAVV